MHATKFDRHSGAEYSRNPLKKSLSVLVWLSILILINQAQPVQADLPCTPGPHGGNISSDQLWCTQDNPHQVTGNLVVSQGVTLTVQPGVQVIFTPGVGMNIQGNLDANGLEEHKISFTTSTEGTYFTAITFSQMSSGSLAYCDISRASGLQGALLIQSSNILIDHSQIHDNNPTAGGIYIGYIGAAGLTPTIQNTSISSNTGFAIYHFSFDIAPTYKNLILIGNGTDGVYLNGGTFNRDVTLDSRELGGKPYITGGTVTVNTGYTLSLAPFTTLRMAAGGYLTIGQAAGLIAVGTQTEPILITSTTSETTFNGLQFQQNSMVSMDYVNISRASGAQGALSIQSSNVLIDHSHIHDNNPTAGGIYIGYIAAAGLTPTIQNTTIANNTGYAIYHYSFDIDPTYRNLTFSGNGTDAVYLNSGTFNRDVTLDSRELGGKPYYTAGWINVANGYTLTLAPGTTLLFPQAGGTGGGISIASGASLVAEGTAAQPIYISTIDGVDNFGTLDLKVGSSAKLVYCDISHAGPVQGVLSVHSSDVLIDHCFIHHNKPSVGAIWLVEAGISPTIKNSSLANNSNYAIYQNTPDMSPIYQDLVASGNGTDAIGIANGSISTGRNWSLGQSGLAGILAGGVSIQATGFLSLDPGTRLKIGLDTSLTDYGGLYALGTSTKPIVVSGISDSMNAWRSVIMNNGSKAILEYVEFMNGGDDGQPMLRIGTSQFSMQNCQVHHSASYGIEVINNTIPVLHYNQIYSNNFGLRNTSISTTVDATLNWWGDASGPYHATLNPGGSGNPVSDYVLFEPWLSAPEQIGALPIGSVYVDLVGQTRASPGSTVDFAIWYSNLSTSTIHDAVLVLALPSSAIFKTSSEGGNLWAARQQVFWKLYDLEPGESGAVAVRAEYQWGIPDLTLESSMAIMLGSELESGQLALADYMAYQPYIATTKNIISEAQFNSYLPSLDDLDILYNAMLDLGYYKGAFNEQTMNNGDLFLQALLLKQDLSEIVLVSGSTNGAMSMIIGRTYITLVSTTYSATYNLQNSYIDYHALPLDGYSAVSPVNDTVNCLTNCLILETGTSLLMEFAPTLGKIGTIADCTAFLAEPSNSEALASCAAGIQTAIPGAGTIVSAVNCYNRSVANPDHCKCSSSLWEASKMPIANTEACKKTPCVDGLYATYDQSVYACPFCTKCVGGSGGSEYPWDHCKPTEATPPVECRSTTGFSILSQSSDETSNSADVFDGMKNCILIPRDPNAKYGRDGDLVPGQEITYTITYENEGAGRAYGVYITDTLDENLDDDTLVIEGNGIYIPSTRQIFWTIGELGPKGDADSMGEVSFRVRLQEGVASGTAVFNTATVYFPSVPEITPTNAVVNFVQPVTALPQVVETESMTPVLITLQGMDAGGAALSFDVIQWPLHGELAGVSPSLTYTPMDNFSGQDKFTYTASNGISTSEPVDVSISVLPSNEDIQSPEIWWTEPSDQATDVPYKASAAFVDEFGAIYAPFPIIQFSEAMQAATITETNLSMWSETNQKLECSVVYDAYGNQAWLYPREPFNSGMLYTIRISTQATDLIGNPLAAEYSFSFRVGSAVDLGAIYLPLIMR